MVEKFLKLDNDITVLKERKSPYFSEMCTEILTKVIIGCQEVALK